MFYAAAVLVLMTVLSATPVKAQSIRVVMKPYAYNTDSIGVAGIECSYRYSWLKDTTAVMSDDGVLLSGDSAALVSSVMLLQCGNGLSRFYSYEKFWLDSLYFADEQKWAQSYVLDVPFFTVYKNWPAQGRMVVTDNIAGEDYRVVEDMPDFGWKLCDEWKDMLGYRVRKAVCSFRGRDYVAWYAPEIPVPDGPWKFSGLPGLIFEVRDVRNQYRYELEGIVLKETAVVMPDLNYRKVTLAEYLRTLKRYLQSPMSFEMDVDNIASVHVFKPAEGEDPTALGYELQEIL